MNEIHIAVLRVEPVKHKHLDVMSTTTHIDDRSALHRVLVGSGDTRLDALAIINGHKLASSKTSTVAARLILTANSEYFNQIAPGWQEGQTSPELERWIVTNTTWLAQQYGEGVASVVLHADETAVYLNVVIVPVCTYSIRFRRGEKEVKRINYGHLFADTKAIIWAARKSKTTDSATKLGRLQTNYAEALSGLNLVRGVRNSLAKHQDSLKPINRFQNQVKPWLDACFGAAIAGDKTERNQRFLEESLELVQSCGCTQSEAHQLVDYVFGRAVGEPAQEVGGVMVTLAALCLAHALDMHKAGATELERIWTKVDEIRAKQSAKPRFGVVQEVPDVRA